MIVIFRPLLVSGMTATRDSVTVVLIDSEQPEKEQARAIWHETVHALLIGAGAKPGDHDEQRIERAAIKLAKACPEIARWLKEKR